MEINVTPPKWPRNAKSKYSDCAICQEAIDAVLREACPSCEVIVHDMKDSQVVRRAKNFGIRSVPAVVIDSKLSSCCTGSGINIQVLRSEGLGKGL
jgi:predicted transcriptional regulator YheO